MDFYDNDNNILIDVDDLDEEMEETKIIQQLINQYKSNKSTYGENLNDILVDRENIVDNFLDLLNSNSKVPTNSLYNVFYDQDKQLGYIYGSNKNGFIKYNNGRSFNNSLHALNPFEIVYNIERLTPITLNLRDRTLIYNYSIENAYNLINNNHLEEFKTYTYFKRLGYAISYDFWECD
ncbi:uncharacterized protein HGUI_02231 [Hanseniaspora guilliermondii]|uniref:Uncharacterized protein n=1 Tax=Hanseniaspora guilliermondii TaxID=56406 RepID=A0A1L0CYQ3_9ASCO|nr:uncharacterized protein HGUI_02231 [Hanseniaspora guilliermondii]